MFLPGANPDRFRQKPIPLPERGSFLEKRIRTVNVLTDLLDNLLIKDNFALRRGNPLQVTVVGNGRPEEFVATQLYFGHSANMQVIERDTNTLDLASEFHGLLLDHVRRATRYRFAQTTYTRADVFGN